VYNAPPTAAPAMPPVTAYTSPTIGAAPISYPTSFLQLRTMPPLAPSTPANGLGYYPVSNIDHPMFHHPHYVTSPVAPNHLPLSTYPGVAIAHSPIVIPTNPGNGFAGFVTGHSYLHHDIASTSIYFPNYVSNPYIVHNGADAKPGNFQYPASFLEQRRRHHRQTALPASAQWIQPPDPKNNFGSGVPLTPSNDIRPGAGTAPFPGVNANQGTVMMYGSNDPSKYEDPHPPPGNGGPAWSHQSSVQNPQYQQTNTFVKAEQPPKLPQFTMPKRRLRRR